MKSSIRGESGNSKWTGGGAYCGGQGYRKVRGGYKIRSEGYLYEEAGDRKGRRQLNRGTVFAQKTLNLTIRNWENSPDEPITRNQKSQWEKC